MNRFFSRWLAGLVLVCLSSLAPAQDKLDNAQLDQLMAPIALYPDALLSQIFMASTYPDDVAAAAEWSKANQRMSGDAAVKAVEDKEWDPSVQSLAAFPSVLDMMGRQPQWVVSVGNAFLDQPDDAMNSVQRLRAQAQSAGALKTTEQQKVTTVTQGAAQVIQIEPANPQVVYVPTYNPATVYGTWAYPAYPPYYYPPPPGSYFASAVVAGIGFGIGVAAVNSLWGGFNWGRGDVNINVNRYNSVNVNRRINANQSTWTHNATHRGSTPYRGDAARQRFDSQRQAGLSNRSAANARDAQRDRAARSIQQRTGQPVTGRQGGLANRPGAGGAGERGDRIGQGGGANRPGAGGAGERRDRVGQGGAGRENAAARQRDDRSAAQNRSRAANKDSAFRDAGQGDRVRQQAQRPGAQHVAARPNAGAARPAAAARPHPAARPSGGFGGGGGAHAGGGARGGGGMRGGGGHGRR